MAYLAKAKHRRWERFRHIGTCRLASTAFGHMSSDSNLKLPTKLAEEANEIAIRIDEFSRKLDTHIRATNEEDKDNGERQPNHP